MITGKNHGKKGICVKRFVLFLLALMLLFGVSSAEEKGLNMENNSRVFYEIFVGSFSDSDGDGTGDLRGVINRMDYLNDGKGIPASARCPQCPGCFRIPDPRRSGNPAG